MIPAPPRISPREPSPARRESRPPAPRAPAPASLARRAGPPRPSPRRAACPEAHRPQLAPRLTTQASPPFRHATRDSAQPPHPRSRPTSPRPPPVPRPAPACASSPSYPRLLSCTVDYTCVLGSHHAYLSPLTPQPDGYLSLEQFNERGVLPHRFGRAPRSLKVSSRVAWRLRLAVDVRMTQRVAPVRDWARPRGRPSLGIVSNSLLNESVGDSEDPRA